ncbi:MAG: cytochrome P450 [Solirubrobacterales bacterium]
MLPPEPQSSALVQSARWTYRPLAFMHECRQRYGDAFRASFIGLREPLVFVSDPAVIKALYAEPANGLARGRNIVLEPIVGPHSLLLQEGEPHLARRRLMLPPFHGERMRSYEAVVAAAIGTEIDSWPLDAEFSLHGRMQAVTLEVILRAVFGVSEGPRLNRLRALLSDTLAATASTGLQLIVLLISRFDGGGPWGRAKRRLREVDQLLFAEIAERRRLPDLEQRDDILSMLMQARFEDGEAISDAELRDQLMTLLVAGHETTATALAWTFDLLLRNPAALRRLRESLAAGEEDYLRATISESLRVRPVVPITGRVLAAELEAGDLRLPAGTSVLPAIWLTHTREDVYPEPFAFRPERFLGNGPETFAWIPFGGGIRRCLGASFAEFEMRIVLREVLSRCELLPASARPEAVMRRNVTLSPRRGTPVVVAARGPAVERDLARV